MVVGTWAKDDPRRIFVEGAAWGYWCATGFSMWAHERDDAERQANERYPMEAVEASEAEDAVARTVASDLEPPTREK